MSDELSEKDAYLQSIDIHSRKLFSYSSLFVDPQEEKYRLNDGTQISVPIRRTAPFSPYRGYFDDVQQVAKTLAKEPPKNVIMDLLGESWKHHRGAIYTESNAMRRILTFKEQLADSLHRRHNNKTLLRYFKHWYIYIYRYRVVRCNLVKQYQLKFIGRRFFAWRYVAKLGHQFRIVMKQYWKKHRLLRFRWWKLWTQWMNLKLRIYRDYFDLIGVYQEYAQNTRLKTARFFDRYIQHCYARRIQKAHRRYKIRLLIWAIKKIKNLYMCHFLLKLIRRRKMKEVKRQKEEEEACKLMVERGHLYLRKLLLTKEGKLLLWTYLREISERYEDKENRDAIFPSKSEMPEISFCWTVRGKAMHILRHRCAHEVYEFAKTNFRKMRPPLYCCARCDSKFVIRAAARNHKMTCDVVKPVPSYHAWILCRPVVDAALAPLVEHYYKKMAFDEAQQEKERIKAEQRVIKQINRTKSANQLPKFEHSRVTPKPPMPTVY